MTIKELIEMLNDCMAEVGEDAEVRLMTQQNWPFENEIHGVTTGQDIAAGCEESPESDEDDGNYADDNVIYIVEGGQIGYGTKAAWEVARTA